MTSGGIILSWSWLLTFSAMWPMARLSSSNTTESEHLLLAENCTLNIEFFKSVQKQFKEYSATGNARLVDIRITGIEWSDSSNEIVEVFDPNLWSWVAKGNEFLTQMPMDFHILSFGLTRLAMADLEVNMYAFPNGCVNQLTFEDQRRLVTKELLHLTEGQQGPITNNLGNKDSICRSTYSRRFWFAGNLAGVGKTCCTREELRSGGITRNDCDIAQETDQNVKKVSEMFSVMMTLSVLLPVMITLCVIIWWYGNKKMSFSEDFAEHFTDKLEKWVNFRVRKHHSAEKIPNRDEVDRRGGSPGQPSRVVEDAVKEEHQSKGRETREGNKSITDIENNDIRSEAQTPANGEDMTLWIAKNDLVPYKGSVSLLDLLGLDMRGVKSGKIGITISFLLHFLVLAYWLTFYNFEKETLWRLDSTEKILFNLYGNPYSWLMTDNSLLPFYLAVLLVSVDAVIFVLLTCWWLLEFECLTSCVASKMDEKKVLRVFFYILVINSYIPLYSTCNSIIYVFGGLIICVDKTLPWLAGVILVLYYIQETRQELIQTYTQIKGEMFEVHKEETPHRAIQINDADIERVDYRDGAERERERDERERNKDEKLMDILNRDFLKHMLMEDSTKRVFFEIQEFCRPVLFTRYRGEYSDHDKDERTRSARSDGCRELSDMAQNRLEKKEGTSLDQSGILLEFMFSKRTLRGVCENIKPVRESIKKSALNLGSIVFFVVLMVAIMTVFHPNAAKTEARLLITSIPPLLIVLIRWLAGKMTTEAENKLGADIVKTDIQRLLLRNRPKYFVEVKRSCLWEDYELPLRTEVKGYNPLSEADDFSGVADQYYKDGTTPLMKAAEECDSVRVKMLIKAGADVNLHDEEWGMTAMMYASRDGHKEVVAELINARANVDIQDKRGRTALMYAYNGTDGRLHEGHKEVAAELIKSGAKVDIKDRMWGMTAMMHASRDGHKEVVAELINARANVDIQDSVGRTALMFATGNGHKEVVAELIKVGADMDIQNEDGMTALMRASHLYGHNEIVVELIQAGANVDIKDKDGKTALMHTSELGRQLEAVAQLIGKGAKVNIQDKAGMTALMYASWGGHQEIVAELIGKGAKVNIKDKYGRTALDWAKEGGRRISLDECGIKAYTKIVEMLECKMQNTV